MDPTTGEPIPLEIGKVYLATIEDSGDNGEGLANLDGYIVFVPDAKPGQNVKIRITKVFGRLAFGETVE